MRMKFRPKTAEQSAYPMFVSFTYDGVRCKYFASMSMYGDRRKWYTVKFKHYELNGKKVIRGVSKCLGLKETDVKKLLSQPCPDKNHMQKRAEWLVLKSYIDREQDRRKKRIAEQQRILDEAIARAKAESKIS